MKKYGLIGRSISYSRSKQIHEKMGCPLYQIVEVKEEKDLRNVIENEGFAGFNVTIPYKRSVLPYLDEVEGIAFQINAVNTIVKRDGKCVGYNTDYLGFYESFTRHGFSFQGKNVLILGSGASAKMVRYVACTYDAKKVWMVSRTKEDCLSYDNLKEAYDAHILVNATPVGTEKDWKMLVNLDDFSSLECVFDLVYAPYRSRLLWEAQKRGIPTINGLEMLVYQAYEAEKFFGNSICSESQLERILHEEKRKSRKIILIGMPGVGKTSVGRVLAKQMKIPFFDMDEEIVQREGMAIEEIFAKKGENYFRQCERNLALELEKCGEMVVSSGGGSILQEEIRHIFCKEGVVFLLRRKDAKPWKDQGRPLMKSKEDYQRLYQEREALYTSICDYEIENESISKTVEEVRNIYESNDY